MENSEIRESFVGADQSEEVLFTLKTRLKSMVGWVRMCALGSFIGVVFCLMFALLVLIWGKYFLSLASPQMAASMPIPIYLYGLIYLFTAAIQLIPTISLFKFSRNARKWLQHDDVAQLDKSLSGLGGLFIFYGVITAIGLFFLAIGLLFAGIVSFTAF